MSALCAAVLTNFYLAKAGVFKISGQVQGILFILVIGAATDYSLLYVSRFREALRDSASAWGATKAAWRGSVEAIVASGGTVIAGLLCLLLSDLAFHGPASPDQLSQTLRIQEGQLLPVHLDQPLAGQFLERAGQGLRSRADLVGELRLGNGQFYCLPSS